MTRPPDVPDANLDLVLEREVDVPAHLIWRAWTEPALLKQWFTPAPWTVPDCEIDPRPGGIFRTVMRSPEGKENEGVGCVLEAVPDRRLVWTGALLPGFRPAPESPFPFTAVITLEPTDSGTRYAAIAIHRDEKGRQAHAEMGFHEGWGKALDQLVELVRTL